jgi:hypothetical protein
MPTLPGPNTGEIQHFTGIRLAIQPDIAVDAVSRNRISRFFRIVLRKDESEQRVKPIRPKYGFAIIRPQGEEALLPLWRIVSSPFLGMIRRYGCALIVRCPPYQSRPPHSRLRLVAGRLGLRRAARHRLTFPRPRDQDCCDNCCDCAVVLSRYFLQQPAQHV